MEAFEKAAEARLDDWEVLNAKNNAREAEIVALAHIIIMVSICQQKKRNVEL